MPGYTEPLNSVEPKPTPEQKDIASRFMPGIPKLTMIQMVIVALIVVYAWTARCRTPVLHARSRQAGSLRVQVLHVIFLKAYYKYARQDSS